MIQKTRTISIKYSHCKFIWKKNKVITQIHTSISPIFPSLNATAIFTFFQLYDAPIHFSFFFLHFFLFFLYFLFLSLFSYFIRINSLSLALSFRSFNYFLVPCWVLCQCNQYQMKPNSNTEMLQLNIHVRLSSTYTLMELQKSLHFMHVYSCVYHRCYCYYH